MGRFSTLLIAALTVLAWQSPAWASGDISCEPQWRLWQPEMGGCSNMAVIGPGNDSRVNLLLLLADRWNTLRRPAEAEPAPFFELGDLERAASPPANASEQESRYAYGEGSRCLSNEAGNAAFVEALARNKGVPDAERQMLLAARAGLKPDCAAEGKAAAPALTAQSTAGAEFVVYLEGTAAFYAADYDTARDRFRRLDHAKDRWLRETALYMLGRVEVNRAQLGLYDEYGSRDPDHTIDPAVLSAAETGLKLYARTYPKGLYARSARGLLRRVYWLARDMRRLQAEFAALLALPPAQRGISDVDLAREIDDKLLSKATPEDLDDPLILATADLMRMRVPGEGSATPIGKAALEAQRPKFAREPALFELLLAVHATYVEPSPAAVQRLIPDAARQVAGYVWFSRQVLRGIALQKQQDSRVRAFWTSLLPGAKGTFQRPVLELAIAYHDERAGRLADVFAPGSPVRTPLIREILLQNVADARLLRQQATASEVPQHERDIALFVLLYKEATRGPHADFLRDVTLVPAGASTDPTFWRLIDAEKPPVGLFARRDRLGDYGCPTLIDTQKILAATSGSAKGLICLGEFLRTNNFDYAALDDQPPADELGGTSSLFAGKPFSRGEAYKTLIASPATSASDKAYALYRAVKCYAPSGNNECGGTEVDVAVRKRWFQQLKKDYPASRWAQELEYYW